MPGDRFDTAAGRALRDQRSTVAQQHLRDLLQDADRPQALTFAAGPLTVDFSRMRGDLTTMQLLADKLVELEVVDSISDETVRLALKKTS